MFVNWRMMRCGKSDPWHSKRWVIECRRGKRWRRESRGDRRLGVLRETQRQFPCIMPSIRLGHTVYDLTALRLGRAAQQPHCISSFTFVVLFRTDQESPNGAQNMEVGWQPKNEPEPAKCLWSSSQVNPGQGRTSPLRYSKNVSPCLCSNCITREKPPSLTKALSLCNPLWTELPCCCTGADAGARTRITANWQWRWNHCSKPAIMWKVALDVRARGRSIRGLGHSSLCEYILKWGWNTS